MRRLLCAALLLVACGVLPGSAEAAAVCSRSAAINQTSNAQVIAGVANLRIAVCSIDLVTDTTQKVSIVEGTGTVCATNMVALWGGTTADATHGMSFAANGGVAKTATEPFFWTQTAGKSLCILQSGSGLIGGSISYTLVP